ICIVGRPNAGKSSLFNYLLGERRAVVVEHSGTTRDRVEALMNIQGQHMKLVDTGGYLTDNADIFSGEIKEQIYLAMEEASVILFVVDTIAGVSPADTEVALLLRKSGKAVILVANKTDNEKLRGHAAEFYQLGFGDPMAVSCVHSRGVQGLKKHIFESVMEEDAEIIPQSDRKILRIAIVGRPNVGKSSFVTNILDRKRVIVSDIPGTTRDTIDTHFMFEGDDYILIDTAGIRHRRKIKMPVDTYSIMRSKEAIQRADVAILVLDAADGITKDDIDILRFIEENGKACLIVVNKWDLSGAAEDVSREEYEKHLVYSSNNLGRFPILFVSSKTGKDVMKALSIAKILDSNLDINVSTPSLNNIFSKKDPSRVPIPRKKKRPNFFYIVQSKHRPVEFKYFVNDPGAVLSAHMSFIENQLRGNLPLKGIPIKILIRKSQKREK
ncbi:MAG: ribosome biogenesis GTPase Der, partial [Candidatus Omnitrophota bacterium]